MTAMWEARIKDLLVRYQSAKRDRFTNGSDRGSRITARD
jgi:hypothetical protein